MVRGVVTSEESAVSLRDNGVGDIHCCINVGEVVKVKAKVMAMVGVGVGCWVLDVGVGLCMRCTCHYCNNNNCVHLHFPLHSHSHFPCMWIPVRQSILPLLARVLHTFHRISPKSPRHHMISIATAPPARRAIASFFPRSPNILCLLPSNAVSHALSVSSAAHSTC